MDRLKEKLLNTVNKLTTISLRDDPVKYGLSDLNDKIAQVVYKKSRASRISNVVIVKLGDAQRSLENAKSIYEMKYNRLLAKDETVTQGGTKEERVAIAKGMLLKEIKVIQTLKNDVSEWQDLKICIDNCLNTLKVVKELLAKQILIINDQIHLGEIDSSSFGT